MGIRIKEGLEIKKYEFFFSIIREIKEFKERGWHEGIDNARRGKWGYFCPEYLCNIGYENWEQGKDDTWTIIKWASNITSNFGYYVPPHNGELINEVDRLIN